MKFRLKSINYILNEAIRWQHRHIAFDIEPFNDLTVDESIWTVTGEDPALIFKPKRGIMPRGWYMFKIIISSDIPHFNTKLYIDYGDGFHEEQSIALPTRSNRRTKRLCYFPRMPLRLRFDPCETSCQFSIKTLLLSKVTRTFAKDRMEKKLTNYSITKSSPSTSTQRPSLNDLWKSYNDLFTQLSSSFSSTSLKYQIWLQMNAGGQQSILPHTLSYLPTISVILPVWNTPKTFLCKCIESVLRQTYSNWQLCICNDASTAPHVQEILNHYSSQDPRIVLLQRNQNGHICKASNAALSLATGEYIALLDHDDELAENALFEFALALSNNPNLDLIYSDEDFIDDRGNRSNPHFKSDWNPELLKAHNYVTHLTVIRRCLIDLAGRFREEAGIEGAQDYDLILRCSALTSPERIYHIPKVLYHWRIHPDSTAAGLSAKPYTVEAGRKALRDYLEAMNINATVQNTKVSNFFKVNYLDTQKPLVSLLIPTRDNLYFAKRCIDSIQAKTTYRNYEILILDNQSKKRETLLWLQEINQQPRISVHSFDHPFNYSAINNFGANLASGTILALLNDDVEIITPDWLEEMVSLAIRPENGCIGAKLYYPDDTIQHAGVILGLGGYAAHSHRGHPRASSGYFNRLNVRQNLSAVTGACLVVRREIWDLTKGMDESLTIGYNDVDFCLRVLQEGFLNVFTPYAELYHHESKSRGKEDTPEKIARFEREKIYLLTRWGDVLKRDPYYNPNLTTSREDFSLF